MTLNFTECLVLLLIIQPNIKMDRKGEFEILALKMGRNVRIQGK